MIVSKAGEGDVMQLTTTDSVNKVADWYINELQPEEILRRPNNVVLKTDEVGVVITSNGNGANIMLKQGGD